jgi:hypothetical protein
MKRIPVPKPLRILLLGGLLAFGAQQGIASALQSLRIPGGAAIRAPEGWTNYSVAAGLPMLVAGPETAGGRPIVMVTPMNARLARFNADELRATYDQYREGRRAYMRRRGGEVVAFQDFRTERWNADTEAQVVGYRYRLNGTEFVENSYYATCKGHVIHLKSVMLADHEREFAADVANTVRSLTCTQ